MKEILRKYFIPNKNNEYKPHILRKTSVSILAGLSVFIFFFSVIHGLVITKTDLLSAVIPKALVDLANVERLSSNISSLAINPILEKAAQLKADDMAAKGYFAHMSPDGTEPWFWFQKAGYEYSYAGENLAVNFSDSFDVDRAWMSSASHRANILNGKFTEIGIATAKGYYNGRETVFVVQMFGRPMLRKAIFVETPEPLVSSQVAPEKTATKEIAKPISVPKVLSETDTFIAVENPVAEESLALNGSAEVETIANPSTLLTSPKENINTIYLVLAAVVAIALVLMVFIKIKIQRSG